MFKSVLGITRQRNSEVLANLSGPLPEKNYDRGSAHGYIRFPCI